MYNIVDSFFVGKYSEPALTALSVIYPLQIIIIALAVGTGVGVNTYMARLYAQKYQRRQRKGYCITGNLRQTGNAISCGTAL